MGRLNIYEFIARCNIVHNNKYDYSKTIYQGMNKKIIVICKDHGEFELFAGNHCNLSIGCKHCRHNEYKRHTTDSFIATAKLIHDNYDYTKTRFKNFNSKVLITCDIHGDFEVQAGRHIQHKVGCTNCKLEKNYEITKSNFIDSCKTKYNNKYEYNKTVLNKLTDTVIITCPTHGNFKVNAYTHLNHEHGCTGCMFGVIPEDKDSYVNNITASKVRVVDTKTFIQRSKFTHGDKYGYNKSIYTSAEEKITIFCPSHGYFDQHAHSHSKGTGCPNCKNSRGELRVKQLLTSHNIKFKEQFSFTDCKHISVLKFDFYLPELNTLIEYDGIQHFEPQQIWGGEKALESTILRDDIKNKYAEINGIKLIRFNYKQTNDEINKYIKTLKMEAH